MSSAQKPSKSDFKLTTNAQELLKNRYLRRNEQGSVVETPEQMFRRVAEHVASAEFRFGGEQEELSSKFGKMMREGLFLPNSPTLMNAGLSLGQLSACFVIPIKDSLEDIFEALKHMAIIHQSGGGTGFSFSRLRPRDDVVRSTGGVASGPVSFMQIFNAATEVVRQGGRRRGANMGILRADHPDIKEFVNAKEKPGSLENFNLSVGATDQFMHQALYGGELELLNPRTGKIVNCIEASELFKEMAFSAWKIGDPGILFLDRINQTHTPPGIIEATNPCGEQPLLPYESCNLGSVNLSRFVNKGEINWERLKEIVFLAIRFLDNAIEVNRFPINRMREATLNNRKIGLGVMGFAEMLIKMEISYNSREALSLAEDVMSFISEKAREESVRLGKDRGSFPHFEMSSMKEEAMRNATVTTIAPAGSISIIAGTSSGIEPLFAISFQRHVLGKVLVETSSLFVDVAKKRGIYSQSLMAEIAHKGWLRDIKGVTENLKDLFITALEVPPEQHVRIQAAFQKYTDNAVSKTVNLPQEATVEDVLDVYKLAYQLGCKGITVYRYGSREQVLYLGEKSVSCKACD